MKISKEFKEPLTNYVRMRATSYYKKRIGALLGLTAMVAGLSYVLFEGEKRQPTTVLVDPSEAAATGMQAASTVFDVVSTLDKTIAPALVAIAPELSAAFSIGGLLINLFGGGGGPSADTQMILDKLDEIEK